MKHTLWTIIDLEGTEPTKHIAERTLYRGVIWRKHRLGTHRKTGTVFVAWILTTVLTLRQLERNVLDFLTTAYKAAIPGIPAPSMFPAVKDNFPHHFGYYRRWQCGLP